MREFEPYTAEDLEGVLERGETVNVERLAAAVLVGLRPEKEAAAKPRAAAAVPAKKK